MKIKLIYILLVLSIFTSCEDDVGGAQRGVITEEFLVQDESSARNVLNKVYASYRNEHVVRINAGLMISGIEQVVGSDRLNVYAFGQNNVQSSIVTPSDDYYASLYYIINTSNYLITQLDAGKAGNEITEVAKNQILGEAKILRALARFMLLRVFGEFYDISSSYGIVISNTPVRQEDKLPRNTVSESYDAIIEDLTFGINNAPSSKPHLYVSQVTAKALLAKAYLYKKEFDKAQKLAKEIISDNSEYSLEEVYADIYTKRWKSTEVLFAPYANSDAEVFYTSTDDYGDAVLQPTKKFKLIADKQVGTANDGDATSFRSGYDPRFIFSYQRLTENANTNNHKYPESQIRQNTIMYMRLAEVYLIYAEASARNPANSDYTDAIAKINELRSRANAGATQKIALLPLTLNKAQLLEKVYEERMLELFLETGETWFDLVRYIDLGNLTLDVKKSLTNKNQLIMPIPLRARAGNSRLVQNPGYE